MNIKQFVESHKYKIFEIISIFSYSVGLTPSHEPVALFKNKVHAEEYANLLNQRRFTIKCSTDVYSHHVNFNEVEIAAFKSYELAEFFIKSIEEQLK